MNEDEIASLASHVDGWGFVDDDQSSHRGSVYVF